MAERSNTSTGASGGAIPAKCDSIGRPCWRVFGTLLTPVEDSGLTGEPRIEQVKQSEFLRVQVDVVLQPRLPRCSRYPLNGLPTKTPLIRLAVHLLMLNKRSKQRNHITAERLISQTSRTKRQPTSDHQMISEETGLKHASHRSPRPSRKFASGQHQVVSTALHRVPGLAFSSAVAGHTPLTLPVVTVPQPEQGRGCRGCVHIVPQAASRAATGSNNCGQSILASASNRSHFLSPATHRSVILAGIGVRGSID